MRREDGRNGWLRPPPPIREFIRICVDAIADAHRKTRFACTVSACPSHFSGSGGVSWATWNVDFGLPGGLTSEAMCPLVDRMNRLFPPSICVVR